MGRKPNLEAREHILDVACGLFHEKGFNGVSVDEIAAAAGVKKANLFHYYPSKEALGLAVFEYAAKAYRESVVVHFSREGQDPVESIGKLFSETADSMKKNNCAGGCFIGNLASELSDSNEKMREKLSEYFSYWTQQLAGLLDRAKATGYFKPELEPTVAAEGIVSIYEGALLCCKAKKQVSSLDSAGNMVRQYLMGFRSVEVVLK